MKILHIAALLPLALAAACGQTDPREAQADAIEANAAEHARTVEASADNVADTLEARADRLEAQAKNTGGYDGERLQERADSLDREADIVEDQGDARADAIKTEGEGAAKKIRSQ